LRWRRGWGRSAPCRTRRGGGCRGRSRRCRCAPCRPRRSRAWCGCRRWWWRRRRWRCRGRWRWCAGRSPGRRRPGGRRPTRRVALGRRLIPARRRSGDDCLGDRSPRRRGRRRSPGRYGRAGCRRCRGGGANRRARLLALPVTAARPQVEHARDERRYRENEIRIDGFSRHPVGGLLGPESVYGSITKTPACGPALASRVDACAEVCHPYSQVGQALDAAVDQYASRCDAWNRDVRVERVATGAQWFPCDHVDAHPPSDRQVQVARKRCATGVRLHLDVVTGQRHSIETQSADAGDDRGPCPVLEDEAHAVLFSPQARQVRESLRKVAGELGPRSHRGQRRRDRETKFCAIDHTSRHGERCVEPVGALDL